MKKILAATDFSKASRDAIRYAIDLASDFGAEVEIFNSFVTIPAIGIDGGTGIMNDSIIAAGIENNRIKIEDLVAALPLSAHPGVKISSRVSGGDAVLSIRDYALEKKHDLVVMGSYGESRLSEILFGSTTVDVMKLAPCPVLAVPENSGYHGISRIVYATELEGEDIRAIAKLTAFAAIIDAEVIIFHAFSSKTGDIENKAAAFRTEMQKEVKYPKLRSEMTVYENVHDAILNTVKKELASLVVMRERKRGVFSRVFHPDLVKQINYHTTIPLLTYNDNCL